MDHGARHGRGGEPREPVTLGIRPEGFRIDPEGAVSGTVKLIERLGGLTLLHITLDGEQDITMQIEGSDPTRANNRHPPVGRSRRVSPVRRPRAARWSSAPVIRWLHEF